MALALGGGHGADLPPGGRRPSSPPGFVARRYAGRPRWLPAAAAGLLVRAVGRLRGARPFALALRTAPARGRGGRAPSAVQLVGFGLGLLALLLLAVVRVDVLDAWRQAQMPPAGRPRTSSWSISSRTTSPCPCAQRLRVRRDAATGRLPPAGPRPAGRRSYERAGAPGPVRVRAWPAPGRARLQPVLGARAPPGERESIAGSPGGCDGDDASPPAVLRGNGRRRSTLGIELGDTLTFRVAGEQRHGRVTSLRRVDWDSFKANFFVLASPGTLDGAPSTWITSYYAPPARRTKVAAQWQT
ncbi:MAG: hypothetical protein U5K43_00460 [Halofilum sp. (in: g-proteobacteria)]|nr:hypothetical protein [Halofilum sp. (in: g-proteobacteria)]